MLKVENICLSFDGLKAVNNVSMNIEDGKITALIGPNGAGKTTTFNIIAGVYKPDSGHIYLDGEDIAGLKPYQICRKGITRTYQVIKLFNGMSVLDNVLVGMHTKLNSNFIRDILHVGRSRSEEKAAEEKARELLKLVGLGGYEMFPAGSLPYGRQRLLEIARALASDPKIILLDEPAAGMNSKEKNDLNTRIREIAKRGTTVLIVEHDMSLIMDIADQIYVLNTGCNLAEGTPKEIASNQEVIEAYLGRGDN